MLRRVIWQNFTDVSENLAAAFTIRALMMEAESTSETSVNFYQTAWCNIPADSLLHSCHHENLKSHLSSCGSGRGPVLVDCCEDSNRFLCSVEGKTFIDCLSDC
jgi:hypothetical protein